MTLTELTQSSPSDNFSATTPKRNVLGSNSVLYAKRSVTNRLSHSPAEYVKCCGFTGMWSCNTVPHTIKTLLVFICVQSYTNLLYILLNVNAQYIETANTIYWNMQTLCLIVIQITFTKLLPLLLH
jgi:hypothetical protein